MEKALVSLALKTGDKAAGAKEPQTPPDSAVTLTSGSSPASTAQAPTALKGVSQALLERVCAVGEPHQ